MIDFRHVIGWLVREPRAFAQYRRRESMFVSMVYRAAYPVIPSTSGDVAMLPRSFHPIMASLYEQAEMEGGPTANCWANGQSETADRGRTSSRRLAWSWS